VRALALSIVFRVMRLCGCAARPGRPLRDTKPSDLVGSTWPLDQVATAGRDLPLQGQGELDFASNGTLHGSAGCRGFDASGDQETGVSDAPGQAFEARVVGDSLLIEREGAAGSFVLVAGDGATRKSLSPPR
jgi:hypothetical protein